MSRAQTAFSRDFGRMADLLALLGGRSNGRRLKNGAYSMTVTMPCAGRLYVRSKPGQSGNQASDAVVRHAREWVEGHAHRALADLKKKLAKP